MKWDRGNTCIALVSFAVLFFEIAVTRILSVLLAYHWAFLSVSLVMLGLGAPGVWFALRPPGPAALRRLLVWASALLPLSVAASLRWTHEFGGLGPVYCLCVFLPPVSCMGGAACMLLLAAEARVAMRYAADLAGAGAAALLVIPALEALPTPQLTAGLGLVTLLAAAAAGARPWSLLPPAALLLLLLAWGEPLRVVHTKTYDETRCHLLYEKWTPTARLTFFDRTVWADDGTAFGWGKGSKAPAAPAEQYWMDQDGGAGTPVMRFGGDERSLRHLLYDVTSLGYQVARPQRVAIIGAGGGRDILCAKLAGAAAIDAVEINGDIVAALSTRFREFAGDVYHLPGVRAVVSDGRSFLARSHAAYDLIQLSLIDSYSATAAGGLTLAENSLYTQEAFAVYWQRLAPAGVLAVSRWVVPDLPRLAVLCLATLHDLGVQAPEDHLLVARGGDVATVLLCRQPVAAPMLRRLREVAAARGFEILHAPNGRARGGAVDAAFVRMALDPQAAARAVPGLDLSPPTDDRPFFFLMLDVFGPVDAAAARRAGVAFEAVWALQLLMLCTAAVALVLFFAPFVLRHGPPRQPGFRRGSAYFACLGAGFMLVELPWLQRLILFLGHPSYAATVVLASLLLGAGIGSATAGRLGGDGLSRAGWLAPLLLGGVNLALGPLCALALPCGEAARIALAVALLLPAGFALGPWFPLGMVRFAAQDRAWFWAMNGAAGVLASVCSLALATRYGFSRVAWLGVGSYVLAWLLFGRARRAG